MAFGEIAAAAADGTEKDAERYSARQYLAHRYKAPERRDFPLPDEGFVSEWDAWLRGRNGGFPEEIRALLSGEGTQIWLEATLVGRIPVVYTEDRRTFERLTAILSAKDDSDPLPASVNAFAIPAGHPPFKGHRVICMAKAGYSALSGESAGMGDGEWLEKSAVIRLHHECCHYFTLRVLGGMKNHALDEVVADCAGQLAAFGRYDASLQRKFFGMEGGGRIAPGGRLGFYVKRLPEGAIPLVCRKVEEALDGLEGYLEKNSEMAKTPLRPELIVKLAVLGLSGIAGIMGKIEDPQLEYSGLT
jgi:hypothetical protein